MSHSTLPIPCRRLAPAVLALALCALGPAARAGAEEGRLSLFGHRYSVIVGAKAFVPTAERTRSRYGDVSFAPSLGLWSFTTGPGLGVSVDLGGGRLKQDSRHADSVHGGLGPRYQFRGGDTGFAPYATVRGEVVVARIDDADWRARPGANAELGASVLRHVVVGVRYDFVPRIDGVDLSGASARLALKLF